MPVKYNKIDLDKITLSKPIKDGETRKCNIYYDDTPFIIQTPKRIKIEEEKLLFSLNKKGVFYSSLDDVKNKIVDILDNGGFFKKSFTKDYISRSFTSMIFVNEDGEGEIPIKLFNSKWVNHFNESIEPCYNKTGTCLLLLKSIVFFKNTISIKIELISTKLDPDNVDNYNNYLLEDHITEDDIVSPEPPTIVLDNVYTENNNDISEDFFCD
jgi:hypothetical protein